ncbi:MAG: hypothetical protein LAP21_08420 [Acidobacteriia bacterium]|nr:hypothetical protein [Terriglobia bacterium]
MTKRATTRKKNPGELTFEQVEARKDRGVEGLLNMGESQRAKDLEDEDVEDFAERKGITIVNPKKKGKGKIGIGPRKKKNPTTSDAAAKFEEFHGRKPETVMDIRTKQNDRRNLTGLGRMMYLLTADGVPMKFEDRDKVMLACDPAGNQLYFVGGNQDVTAILKHAGIDQSKDLIDVGECQFIVYTTDKDFDSFEEKDYQHEFGEETGELPRLMYDRLNRQLFLVGGAYEIKREGIVN